MPNKPTTLRELDLHEVATTLYFTEWHSKEEVEDYTKQMAENHAFKIDTNFWMVVKQKPWWMPNFIYKAVIKSLVEFQQHQ